LTSRKAPLSKQETEKYYNTISAAENMNLYVNKVVLAEGKQSTCMNGEEESLHMLDEMMNRGSLLRALRQLETSDNASRRDDQTEFFVSKICPSTNSSCDEPEHSHDVITHLSDGSSVLIYESFLSHQRYYDDFKHCNVTFIDYGNLGLFSDHEEQKRLIIEQRPSLGKGGLCWDAAFILAEHLLATRSCWHSGLYHHPRRRLTNVLELGAGTGVVGLAVAKFVDSCSVTITDLPELMDLMNSNIARNFHMKMQRGIKSVTSAPGLSDVGYHIAGSDNQNVVHNVSAAVLKWGENENYSEEKYQNIDLIIASDVVATIYSSSLLVQTLFDLSGEDTNIFLSYKHREDDLMKDFFHLLRSHFRNIQR
jgi:predicted nicotinamide N-methyase